VETQERSTGRHRIVYRAREDRRLQQLVGVLAEQLTRVVEQGVEAVSPNQRDPDGQRRRVAAELSGALLSEVFRLLAIALAARVQQRVPFGASGVLRAAQEATRGGVRRPPPVIDLTDRRTPTEKRGG